MVTVIGSMASDVSARRNAAGRDLIIRKTPGVVGGSARIRDMRIPVSLMVSWHEQGLSDPEILAQYPGVTRSDLDACWAYAADHDGEIRAELRANDDDARTPAPSR